MKLKVGEFVKVEGGNALNVYEIVALREYEVKEKGTLAVIWGVNNDENGVIGVEHLKSTKPYWSNDEKLPFSTISTYVPKVTPKDPTEVA